MNDQSKTAELDANKFGALIAELERNNHEFTSKSVEIMAGVDSELSAKLDSLVNGSDLSPYSHFIKLKNHPDIHENSDQHELIHAIDDRLEHLRTIFRNEYLRSEVLASQESLKGAIEKGDGKRTPAMSLILGDTNYESVARIAELSVETLRKGTLEVAEKAVKSINRTVEVAPKTLSLFHKSIKFVRERVRDHYVPRYRQERDQNNTTKPGLN
jgi:hypothetical protein